MNFETIISLMGAFGIGGGVTTAVGAWWNFKEKKKSAVFEEKRNAYTGLLNSLHDAALKNSQEAAKGYALWQTRVELVGSPDVIYYVQKMVDTIPGVKDRYQAFEGLTQSMREDLQIDLRPFKKQLK
jgi:hypothetical protein